MKLQSRSYYVRRQEDSRTWLQNEELRALQKRVNSADSAQRDCDKGVEWMDRVACIGAYCWSVVRDNLQMSDFRKANMWLNACHSTQNTGLVLRGWLQARLPLCISLTPCRSVCGWVCMCSYEGIHFVQWVFKELSTETGFPQTTITSIPDTPNFLFWYFFFSFAFISVSPFCYSPEGESPSTFSLQDWDYFLFPIHVATLSRLELKLCGASTFSSSTRWEELREGVTAAKGRGEERDSALLQTWTTACRLTCPEAGLLRVAHFRRSLSILFFFSITIGWRMKLSWTEGLPSLNMCVMKKK